MNVIVDGYVWIKLDDLSIEQRNKLINALTVYPQSNSEFDKEEPSPIRLYKTDREGYIGIARGFYQKFSKKETTYIDRCSDGGKMNPDVECTMRFTGPYAEQANALDKMIEYTRNNTFGGFLLKAGCGFGKTNTALAFAHRLGKRTLILVHKEFFMRQWRERIKEFFPNAKIGRIQQDVCEYKGCDFVIGMLQSIARDKYPDDIYDAFGLVISDECHRIGAQTWSDVIPRFKARYRLGLTATPRRKDGAQNVFYHHIGDILYSATTSAMIPMIRKTFTDFGLKDGVTKRKQKIPVDRLNHTQIVSQIVSNANRNKQIGDLVAKATSIGRKVMVISERRTHLNELEKMVMSAAYQHDTPFDIRCDYYVGGRSEAELEHAERANVILATKQMIEEGLDIPAIDVIVLTTPMSDVEQTVGRVRRHCVPRKSKCDHLCAWRTGACQGKPQPIVVDMIDKNESRLLSKYNKRVRFYKTIGAM